jgi:hypothetical protein
MPKSAKKQYFVLCQLGTTRRPLWKVAEAGCISDKAVAVRLAAALPQSYHAIVVERCDACD